MSIKRTATFLLSTFLMFGVKGLWAAPSSFEQEADALLAAYSPTKKDDFRSYIIGQGLWFPELVRKRAVFRHLTAQEPDMHWPELKEILESACTEQKRRMHASDVLLFRRVAQVVATCAGGYGLFLLISKGVEHFKQLSAASNAGKLLDSVATMNEDQMTGKQKWLIAGTAFLALGCFYALFRHGQASEEVDQEAL